MVSMQQTLLVWSQRTRQTERGGVGGAVLAWCPTLPTCQWQIYKLCLVAKKCPLTGAVFGGRKRQTNSDTTQCTERHVGIKDDIWPRIKVKEKKKEKYFNIKCLWGSLCMWVNWQKIGIPFPRTIPTCFGNTEATLGRSCELFWVLPCVIVHMVCGINVASTALVGQIRFSVSRSNVNLPLRLAEQLKGLWGKHEKEKKCDLISQCHRSIGQCVCVSE